MLDNDARAALIAAIKLIESIDFLGYAAYCAVCGDPVPGLESPLAPIRCGACIFWGDRTYTDKVCVEKNIPNVHSIRAKGQHYTIDGRDEEGPVMTVRYLTGATVVTTRLRTQGPVPRRWASLLLDNAVVSEGNPYQMPMGITRP